MTHEPDSEDEPRELIRLGGQVDESSATLRIFGDDLVPDDITNV